MLDIPTTDLPPITLIGAVFVGAGMWAVIIYVIAWVF